MNRTTRYKALCVASILLLSAGAAVVVLSTDVHPATLVLAGGVFLVPGRVQGYFWRDFLRGRRLLAEDRAAESVTYFTCFLGQLAAKPWLKKLIWLSWGIYTRDIAVMTQTNLGVARMRLGEFDAAEEHLRAAIRGDAQAPLPWHNLGVMFQVRGEVASAHEAFGRARAFGYSAAVSDTLVLAVSEALARCEGRGVRKRAKEA